MITSNLLYTATFSKPTSGSSEQPTANWVKAFTVTAYQPYFDVDTSDILERIKESLFPFKGTFNEKTANRPDLYGPFWICTTLIFVSASIGTSITYLADKIRHKEWDYDIHMLTWSACVLYGYVVIVPITLYIVLKYLSVPLGLVQLLCLYGYSLFVFIPAGVSFCSQLNTVSKFSHSKSRSWFGFVYTRIMIFVCAKLQCLSIVPVEMFRWVVVGVAGFMSAMFVASNLRSHIVSAGERWFWIVSGITLLQLALSIVLKIYLFSVST
ncbi:putative Yip1 domain, protein Yip5/YIPF1/YIPF2 [Helianthus annuus]|nr:putative Yip1 domain, protein Yip5/YIPF1/YIPF2 [Helianthus annuus]